MQNRTSHLLSIAILLSLILALVPSGGAHSARALRASEPARATGANTDPSQPLSTQSAPATVPSRLTAPSAPTNDTGREDNQVAATAPSQESVAPEDAGLVEFVGHIGGFTTDVFVRGDYAYIGEGSALTILDISHSGSPSVVGKTSVFPSEVRGLDVSGEHAYAVHGVSGLRVLDISNPTKPTEVGSWEASVYAGDVFVNGEYAYVADSHDYGGLWVVDVSDPTDPTEVGFHPVRGWLNHARAVHVRDEYAYVAASTNGGLLVIDVSDPTNPTEVARQGTAGHASDVYVSQDHAYVADGQDGGLLVVDVSNPISPTALGYYDTHNHVFKVHVSGQYAYLGVEDGGLSMVDVSDPDDLFEIGYCDTPGQVVGVYVSGDQAYVANHDGGLRVIDVSDPTNPSEVGTYITPVRPMAVYVSGEHAYVVSDRRWGLSVLNVSDPTQPAEAGYLRMPSAMKGVHVQGDYAYIATVNFRVVDVSDPTNPSEVGNCSIPRYSPDLHVSGEYAYVAGGADGGLRVIDVSDPANPTEVGRHDLPAYGIDVSGDYAYVATGTDGGLRVVDVSDPSKPAEVGYCETPGQALKVHAIAGLAYVAESYDGGLSVIDVSDPTDPIKVGYYETEMGIRDVHVSGERAYLATDSTYMYDSGLLVVDVYDPTNPIEVGYYDTPGRPRRVHISDDFAYVAANSGGLIILRYIGTGQTHSISGHVRDDRGHPVADVTISTDSGASTITGASGAYAITGLMAGTYTLTPTLDGHRFAPTTRTVEVPTNATADFIARPATPARFLTLPVPFTDFAVDARGNIDGTGPGLVNCWFDHSQPDYTVDDALVRWDGETYFQNSTNIGRYNCSTKPGQLGVTCYDGHNGLDFQNGRSVYDATNSRMTDPIYAAAPGVVEEVHWEWPSRAGARGPSYGNYVLLDHENGYATFYAHLASVNGSIRKGNRITDTRSVQLGLMGNTGSGSQGVHLHFALYYDADGDREWEERYDATRYTEAVDPYGWLRSLAEFDPWHIPSFYLWEETLGAEYTAGPSEVMLGSTSGNGVVTIPEGALTSETTFELWEVPSAACGESEMRPSGLSIFLWSPDWVSHPTGASAVSLSSTGFAKPITVSITYTDTETAHLDATRVAIYHRGSDFALWAPLSTTVETGRNEATAQTTDAGYFSLQAPLACPADAQEPDDGYSAAGTASTDGALQLHVFDTAQDEDWVRFVAAQGIPCAIRTADLAEGVDPVVEIYDTDGVTLLASDDNNGGTRDSYLEWIPPLDGAYFVRVTQAPGSSYGCDAAYSLSVQQDKRLYLPLVLRHGFGE